MRSFPSGTFWMGGGGGICGGQRVEIERGFALGVFPVTQAQWQAVMGTNPSFFSRTSRGRDRVKDIPDEELGQFSVENVSWEDAQQLLRRLNENERAGGWVHRLPSDAEWKYACRGGASSKRGCSFHFYLARPTNDLSSEQANFDGNLPAGNAPGGRYLGRPTKVGSYQPNAPGLYDMHGNVWEWCQSWYTEGEDRVIRGGSWGTSGSHCRAASRLRYSPSGREVNLGLRLARAPRA